MVGSDHFHQLWLDNMPQFLVGHAERYDANWYNDEREFGLPRMTLRGDRELFYVDLGLMPCASECTAGRPSLACCHGRTSGRPASWMGQGPADAESLLPGGKRGLWRPRR